MERNLARLKCLCALIIINVLSLVIGCEDSKDTHSYSLQQYTENPAVLFKQLFECHSPETAQGLDCKHVSQSAAQYSSIDDRYHHLQNQWQKNHRNLVGEKRENLKKQLDNQQKLYKLKRAHAEEKYLLLANQ